MKYTALVFPSLTPKVNEGKAEDELTGLLTEESSQSLLSRQKHLSVLLGHQALLNVPHVY